MKLMTGDTKLTVDDCETLDDRNSRSITITFVGLRFYLDNVVGRLAGKSC